MSRHVNYDSKIKAIEAKIEKKTNEVKNLKEKIKDMVGENFPEMKDLQIHQISDNSD